VIETYTGHYEYRDRSPHDGWCHLQVYEARDAATIIIAAPCRHNRARPLTEGADELARRVFAHLIPYARDHFRWFERSNTSADPDQSGNAGLTEIRFAARDTSGGWIFTVRERLPTDQETVVALIGHDPGPVPCAETDTPPHRFRTLESVITDDDPWYLPPDTPIPATFHIGGGQVIRTIAKVERSRRERLLEQKALERRRQLLGY
jgi:hypothetical protein